MEKIFDGKVALVTGALRYGARHSPSLRAKGAKVVVATRKNVVDGEAVAASIRAPREATFVRCDVSKKIIEKWSERP